MREHEPARVDRGPVAAQRQRGDLRGAIASKRCYLDLSGANISASHAKRGGGVSFNNGRIVRTIVSGCSAEIGGGVLELMAEGPLSIEYSTISSNHASYTGGGVAIFFTGPSVIKRSTINNNFKGRFDMGWDAAREQILKNQVAKGIVPAGTKLARAPPTSLCGASCRQTAGKCTRGRWRRSPRCSRRPTTRSAASSMR